MDETLYEDSFKIGGKLTLYNYVSQLFFKKLFVVLRGIANRLQQLL